MQAQTPALRPAGAISGLVIDAASALPLSGARVVLEPRTGGAFPAPSPGASAFIQATRTAVTDSAGRYRFANVPPGEYRLHVQRLGYRSTSVGVDLRGAGDSRVSVGLDMEAVALQPLEVSAPASTLTSRTNTYARAAPRALEGDLRIQAERMRQSRHLSSDVRAVTHADVTEGITLGETDLFRALQRLPGVTTRDDYTSELWTRGAPWDHSRVLFDGLPLFNPLHALGMFSGVNPDAVGAASFHPGVQPASAGGGAAGLVDLQSRRGGGEGLRGFGELSLVSARLALDKEILNGRGAWMIAARRTYLDWLTLGIEKLTDEPYTALPYSFADVAGRFDYQIDSTRTLEVSGLWEYDKVARDLPDLIHGNRIVWGNKAGRITLAAPLAGGQARHTVGLSRFASRISERPIPEDIPFDEGRLPNSANSIWFGSAGSEWALPGAPWSVGYRLEAHGSNYEGPGLNPYLGEVLEDTLAMNSLLAVGVLWGERRWKPWQPVTVDAGIRMELGEGVRNAGPIRLAPRISARYQTSTAVSLSAGLGRGYQYEQSLSGRTAWFDSGFELPTWNLWLLAGDSIPAIRSDIATFGAETWIGSSWIAAVNAYSRWQSGLAVPDPTPGIVLNRPLFVMAEGEARGIEFSARRLTGRWTASLAYSYGISELEAAGLRYPAPTERRHVLDATSMLRLGSSVRLGAAYTAASGAPYTRVHLGGFFEPDQPPRAEAPSSRRGPAYGSLDVLAEWNHSFRRWELGAYLQVRNALNRSNGGMYMRFDDCPESCGIINGERFGGPGRDEFLPGMPILPLFGFRIAF